jgi:hypothetical protein
MGRVFNGVVAGFVATVVTALVLIGGTRSGVLVGVDPVTELTTVATRYKFGPVTPETGWAAYFIVGTVVLGFVYSLVRTLLPRGPVISGLIFGALVWTVDVVFVQPLTGAGLLARGVPAGLNEGAAALFLDLVFGVVLGIVFANLRSSAAARDVVPG